jgi:hypothetical protein
MVGMKYVCGYDIIFADKKLIMLMKLR